jgi:hypothetical protein
MAKRQRRRGITLPAVAGFFMALVIALPATSADASSPPAPPSGLSFSVTDRTLRVSWLDNSTNESGFLIQVQIRIAKGRLKSNSSNLPANTESYVQTVPADSQPHEMRFRVAAYNGSGFAWTKWSIFRKVPEISNVPYNLKISLIHNDGPPASVYAQVTWDARPGADIAGFQIYEWLYVTMDGHTWEDWADFGNAREWTAPWGLLASAPSEYLCVGLSARAGNGVFSPWAQGGQNSFLYKPPSTSSRLGRPDKDHVVCIQLP